MRVTIKGHIAYIDCLTLSDILKLTGLERVDLLKLDCEGNELAILQCFSEYDFKRFEELLMEIHGDTRPIIELLRRNSFCEVESKEHNGSHIHNFKRAV